MKSRKRIVIVGATSGIAEQCARIWVARQAADLFLVGRDLARLQRVTQDLLARSPESTVHSIQADLVDPLVIQHAVDSIASSGDLDIVLVAHGFLPDQKECQRDLKLCHRALEVNAVSPALWAEGFAQYMEKANSGVIAIIGSVAGDRGRKSNYVYGAAKGLLERYAQGLRHRLAATNVKVVLVKPGPTDTPMTQHLKSEGARLANPQQVAKLIVSGIGRGVSVVYAPPVWRFIMLVIGGLPNFIFNRMDI